MKLKVLVPDRILVEREVSRISAWAHNGSFCLLPRHVDFATALAPGLLAYEDDEEHAEFLALDEGVLVKQGAEVLVATRKAVSEPELEQLKRDLEEKIVALETEEQETRDVVARLESDFARYIMEGEDDD